jgi:hypothetical protein
MTLTLKNKKSSGDYKELGELFKNYKEFARIERYKEVVMKRISIQILPSVTQHPRRKRK